MDWIIVHWQNPGEMYVSDQKPKRKNYLKKLLPILLGIVRLL